MINDLRRRVVDAMLAVDVKNGGKADMYMLADAAIAEFRLLLTEHSLDRTASLAADSLAILRRMNAMADDILGRISPPENP